MAIPPINAILGRVASTLPIFSLNFPYPETSEEHAFSVAAPRLWNELPSDVRKAFTLATLKTSQNRFVFQTLRHSVRAVRIL